MKFDSWKFDDLDLVRALLSALSWREQDAVNPVSAVSIHHELVRRNRDINAASALSTLSRIGDAQQLEHGYWLPCPTHGATDGDIVVVVSCESTEALAMSLSSSIRHGDYGRYFTPTWEESSRLATVSISQWLGVPRSSVEWLNSYLESAAFAPPIQLSDVEVYRHWPGRAARRWVSLAEAFSSSERYVLARIETRGARQYMFLNIVRRTLKSFHELPVGFDLVRAICALRRISGDPITIDSTLNESREQITVTCPFVPDGERVFLQCVGAVVVRDDSSMFEVELPREAQADVIRLFTTLGCSVQETRG